MTYSSENKRPLALLVFALFTLLVVNYVYPSATSGKFPIATTAKKEFAVSLAFDGTNFLVGIQGDSANIDSVGAQLVSPAGMLVGSIVPTGRLGGAPSVAFDGTNYLIVWQDCGTPCNNDLFGMFISPSGTAVGSPFFISATMQEIGGLAFGGTNYLVVYYEEVDVPTSNSKVRGRLISPGGTVGGEITLSTGFGDHAKNAVAFDGNNFLAVWIDDVGDSVVQGRFVSSSGTLGAEFTVNASSFPSDNPASVAFDGTDYLVIWADQVGGPGGQWDLLGQLVDTAGSAVGGVIDVSTAPGTQLFPFIAFGEGNYLVAWTDLRNDANGDFVCDAGEGSCLDIRGQFLTKSGALSSPEIVINAESGNQFVSPVAHTGSRFLVAWADGDVIDGLVGDVFGTFVSPSLLFFRAETCLNDDLATGICQP